VTQERRERLRGIVHGPLTEPFGRGAIRDLLIDLEQAEAELTRLRERERKLATMFGVPDGGQYLNDWQERADAFTRLRKREERLMEALREARDCERAFVNKDEAHSATLRILDAALSESGDE
jgi:hypothetical protein